MVLTENTVPKRLKRIQSFRNISAEELGVDKIVMHKVCVHVVCARQQVRGRDVHTEVVIGS